MGRGVCDLVGGGVGGGFSGGLGALVGGLVIKVHVWALWGLAQPLLHQWVFLQPQLQPLLPS